MSGDCFFNFNSNKIELLKEISGIDKEKLKKCGEMHYSVYNMVLLQTMGNMQKRKQWGLGLTSQHGKYENLDRGDTFLYLLNEFFQNNNEYICSASTKSNKDVLKKYLNSFDEVKDYAAKMLQIEDENFIDKLIKNGEKQLDSACVNDYLNIALEFWEKRKCKIGQL